MKKMTKSMKKLSAKGVRVIRDKLGLSCKRLADRIDVSPETIRSWEDTCGNKKGKLCGGPARILLLLLEQAPNVIDLLEKSIKRSKHLLSVDTDNKDTPNAM